MQPREEWTAESEFLVSGFERRMWAPLCAVAANQVLASVTATMPTTAPSGAEEMAIDAVAMLARGCSIAELDEWSERFRCLVEALDANQAFYPDSAFYDPRLRALDAFLGAVSMGLERASRGATFAAIDVVYSVRECHSAFGFLDPACEDPYDADMVYSSPFQLALRDAWRGIVASPELTIETGMALSGEFSEYLADVAKKRHARGGGGG